jgi:hypothetical protein
VPDKPRLTTLDLTGWRKTLRLALFFAIVACAALAALGYFLPAHRAAYVPDSGAWVDLSSQPGEEHFHSNYADGGPLPFAVLIVAAVVAFFLRKLRFGVGFATGVVGAGAAVVSIGAVLLAHMFSRQDSSIGEPVFVLAIIGLFVASCALFIAEPIVHILEKRRLIAASLPAPLPRAIAV